MNKIGTFFAFTYTILCLIVLWPFILIGQYRYKKYYAKRMQDIAARKEKL